MYTHVWQSIRHVSQWFIKVGPTARRGGRSPCLPPRLLSYMGGMALVTLTSFAADNSRASATLLPDGGRLVVDVQGVPPPAPLFFSASVEQVIRLGLAEIAGEARVRLRVVQGRPEVLTLGLSGDGEVVEVSGKALRDWSVRQGTGPEAGKRFLDLRPVLPAVSASAATNVSPALDYDVLVRTRLRKPPVPGSVAMLLITQGEAVGFAAKVHLQPEAAIDLKVTAVTGMVPAGNTTSTPTARDGPQFFSTGEGRIEVQLAPRGAGTAEAELVGAQLSGTLNETGRSVDFRLTAQLRAQKAGARLRILSGRAALSDAAAGAGWHVELVAIEDRRFAYDLVADREGVTAVQLAFAAAVSEAGDWRALEFAMPAGAVVPLQVQGLEAGVSFKMDAPVVPAATAEGWRGFLPANGVASLAWKRTREAGDSALAFTSSEQTEVRIAAGLLRQSSRLAFRILQGKLPAVRVRLDGPGEILGVEGTNVVGWSVHPRDGGRLLEVRLSRPMETQGALTITSQLELGTWPVRAEPLRLTPEAGVRHSGFVRIANSGAVRLEIADANGMMQLAPAQFPGAAIEKEARQVFVYRFPSASYGYRVLATQIQPEVGVSAIAIYELTDTARVIQASVELDVREATLREWSLRVPEDYTVVTVTGSDVADYVVESEAANGTRALRVLFGRAIEGRQLLQLRLEKNQPAAAGDWNLPALQFPGAKTVRGHVGAVSTPGYRLVPARADRLVEVPLSFFPKQTPGLQQAWRVREPDWTADVRIEALGQSIQADVFHLYSLKQGVVSSSVLLNYFVVGAPATEWRIEVPAAVGNIDVIGQNVRRDWRREGDQVIVALHQPVLGAATLLITFEQPMSARGGTIQPGVVRPLGVQAERGFVQVVSPLQVKHAVKRADGALLKLEPMELPAEFRTLTNAPSIATYHYTARPFALEMDFEWYTPGETVDQVVDFAKLASQVSRDGQVVTEATFFVKTRGRKALRLVLPAGVKLWEARVDREVVNAQADGEQILLPLPARSNPNEPVVVALRVGQPAGNSSGSNVTLIAPRAAVAPTVISEWVVRSDTGRVLVPKAGNAELVRPVLTESGFEWVTERGPIGTFVVLSLIGLGTLLMSASTGWRVPVGLLTCAIAAGVALVVAGNAWNHRRPNLPEMTFATTVVPAGESVALQVANLPEWRAMIVSWGIAAAAAGIGLIVGGRWMASRDRRAGRQTLFTSAAMVAGVLLLASGLLAQRGGAVLFFGAASVAVLMQIVVPGLTIWRRERREGEPPVTAAGPGPAPVVSFLLLLGLAGLGSPGNRLDAAPAPKSTMVALPVRADVPANVVLPDGTKAAQSMVQSWSLRGERLFAEVELTVRGEPGDSFLLLRAPGVLTDFNGDGLRIVKVERDGASAFYVSPERSGVLTARVRFELAVADRTKPIPLPTGPAATQRVTIELDQGGWEFVSPGAVQISPTTGLGENRSGATLVLAPQEAPTIQAQPKRRDLSAEATQFFVEGASLYLPGPGVVNGLTRLTVRPVQGRVSALEIVVPEGFTIGEVSRGPVGTWRFDPQTRRLQVAIEPAQTGVFALEVEMQRGAGELPFALALEPLRVTGASSDVGMIGVGFAGDAQPESLRAVALSAISAQDFDATLLPRTREGQPLVTLQHVWRYGATGGRVDLKVAAVAPEVRVTSRQVLSLDDDRMLMSVDLRVAISRVGLFKLSFPLPEGLEVEALSGGVLNQWTEALEGTQRIVTLHLNGRTLGEHPFNLTLAGVAPKTQDAWSFPRLVVREATRQTGEVLIVPGKGIRLRAMDREKVTQLDPRTVGGMQPGTLAFRLLQEDWVLRIGIETLEAWVTVQSLQEVTLREGQTLTRLGLRYRVENAAVKQVQVKLPGLSEESARTVRATGPAVSDIVRVNGTPDLWEIRFQRGIAGETDVQIEFQSTVARERGEEAITTPEFVGTRQVVQFVAVRGGGRLELEAARLPRGWTRLDWSAVPGHLQQRTDRSVPALCFRVAEPESALAVTVRRHEVADALKLRVTQGDLMTLFAPTGAFLTAMDLKVEVLEKSTLRLRLPVGAKLFNTVVNNESVSAVREGDAWLFHVAPSAAGGRVAQVRVVYSAVANTRGDVALLGPSLSVPLENVTWRVVIPPGYELEDYRGGLRLRDERSGRAFGIEDYQTFVSSKRSADAKEAMSILQQASSWLQKGEQDKAAEALSRVSNANTLDEASNEDARVQLRSLKTQQAVIGLNTRRQKLYLDNRADVARNESLEQAVNLNPFLQGKVNYHPQQVDQLLMGNTVEENTALRGIATKIVDQQLSADPAPGAIDVTLPERGQVLTFTRSVQVDGGAPLELKLDLAKTSGANRTLIWILLLAVAIIAAIPFSRRHEREATNAA
jgi:hypothetical protein